MREWGKWGEAGEDYFAGHCEVDVLGNLVCLPLGLCEDHGLPRCSIDSEDVH